jgi:hypothetical protein
VTTAELLIEGTQIMNEKGVDSKEFKEFLKAHSANEEFSQLIKTAMWLRGKIEAYKGKKKS